MGGKQTRTHERRREVKGRGRETDAHTCKEKRGEGEREGRTHMKGEERIKGEEGKQTHTHSSPFMCVRPLPSLSPSPLLYRVEYE